LALLWHSPAENHTLAKGSVSTTPSLVKAEASLIPLPHISPLPIAYTYTHTYIHTYTQLPIVDIGSSPYISPPHHIHTFTHTPSSPSSTLGRGLVRMC
jgi:hypothetical protein